MRVVRTWLGLDPGWSGGLGVLATDADGNVQARAFPWPDTAEDTWRLLATYTGSVAVIESVHAMPKQGVSSTFKFGVHFGLLQGLLAAAHISHTFVTPGVWQRAMGCLSRGDKRVTKTRCQQIFPGIPVTHRTADGLLLAEYCRRTTP